MDLKHLKSNAVERRNFLAPCLKYDDQKFEFIFVLDRSSSMRGHRIILARRALLLFLRSLPASCLFNVIGFGGRHISLFPSSVLYNQKNLDMASAHANEVQADLPGTKLIPPLTEIYSSQHQPGYLKQIFVLTDGENREGYQAAVDLVKRHKQFARVFALGIGSHVNHKLIYGISSEGGGLPAFVASSSDKIETEVLDQLKAALKPSLLKAVQV